MQQDEAVAKIRGPQGTQVSLTIQRDGEKEFRNYSITRENIQLKTVNAKMLDNRIGYIRITTFNESTGHDFSKAFNDLGKQGMQALILDLRDNPGGLLNECIKVARNFIPKGTIVSVEGRDGKKEVYTSDLVHSKYPMAVLINGGSASASEIVAGAVQDTKAGTLIGTKTYGKGSVQTIFDLYDGTAVKLTVAKYLTPAGRFINGKGIEPDIVIANTEGQDLQLLRAIEILTNKP